MVYQRVEINSPYRIRMREDLTVHSCGTGSVGWKKERSQMNIDEICS
jgi:hypothetical protein